MTEDRCKVIGYHEPLWRSPWNLKRINESRQALLMRHSKQQTQARQPGSAMRLEVILAATLWIGDCRKKLYKIDLRPRSINHPHNLVHWQLFWTFFRTNSPIRIVQPHWKSRICILEDLLCLHKGIDYLRRQVKDGRMFSALRSVLKLLYTSEVVPFNATGKRSCQNCIWDSCLCRLCLIIVLATEEDLYPDIVVAIRMCRLDGLVLELNDILV